MLDAMQASFEIWANQPVQREVLVEEVRHDSWTVSQVLAPLGVVGFVFEGRPNVVVDACGVLVTGNSCVFRIGRDARRTAEAIIKEVIEVALLENGLPADSVVLIPRDDHASGWALFSNGDVSLAVARGSGAAVQDLGSVASQSGVPVSLHGRGGAWFLVGDSADQSRLLATLRNSLDRKVCNTANVVTIPISQATQWLTTILKAVDEAAAARNANGIVHVIASHDIDPLGYVDFSSTRLKVVAADIDVVQTEWEWENDPEITVLIVDGFEQAVSLFNESSPRLVASIISEDPSDHEFGWNHLSCPFVGDGFSRWVDGQFALRRPELGLSNWENGVPLGRGAILSGADIHSVRYRVKQIDENLRR
jgi:glutamate-5-semialdehyde dehydrogenase